MQDVLFEMKYEPGRDELDPLDFLSRHPLPVIGNDDTEKVLKAVITTEHAVVLDRIRQETSLIIISIISNIYNVQIP